MIVIACSDPKRANRWHRALAKKYPLHVVAQKTALVNALSRLKPRLLILDASLPGLRLAKEFPTMQRLSPLTKILVLSDTPRADKGVAIIKAGAKGYSSHKLGSSLLNKAVRRILNGELWAGREVLSKLIEEMIPLSKINEPKSTPKGSLESLTARKREIAQLVVEGATNRAIADRLHISEAAVKAHLTSIFRRFKLSGRLQLALLLATTITQ